MLPVFWYGFSPPISGMCVIGINHQTDWFQSQHTLQYVTRDYHIYLHISRSAYKSTPCFCRWNNDQNARPKYKSTPNIKTMTASAHLHSHIMSFGLEFDREPLWTDFTTERSDDCSIHNECLQDCLPITGQRLSHATHRYHENTHVISHTSFPPCDRTPIRMRVPPLSVVLSLSKLLLCT